MRVCVCVCVRVLRNRIVSRTRFWALQIVKYFNYYYMNILKTQLSVSALKVKVKYFAYWPMAVSHALL